MTHRLTRLSCSLLSAGKDLVPKSSVQDEEEADGEKRAGIQLRAENSSLPASPFPFSPTKSSQSEHIPFRSDAEIQ